MPASQRGLRFWLGEAARPKDFCYAEHALNDSSREYLRAEGNRGGSPYGFRLDDALGKRKSAASRTQLLGLSVAKRPNFSPAIPFGDYARRLSENTRKVR
jgi:hypothetical protein